MIPKTMMKLDQVFHSIVTMINDTVAPATGANAQAMDPDNGSTPNNKLNYIGAQDPDTYTPGAFVQDPNAPYDNNKMQSYVEIFTRCSGPGVYMDRWTEDGNLNPEMKGDYYTQYSIGNVQINPELLENDDNFNLIALSESGDIEDTRLLNALQQLWKSATSEYAVEIEGISFNMDESYNKFVSQIAPEVSEAKNFVEGQTVQTERV